MERLRAHAADLLKLEERLILAGDYNIIPEPEDADKPESWLGDALFQRTAQRVPGYQEPGPDRCLHAG